MSHVIPPPLEHSPSLLASAFGSEPPVGSSRRSSASSAVASSFGAAGASTLGGDPGSRPITPPKSSTQSLSATPSTDSLAWLTGPAAQLPSTAMRRRRALAGRRSRSTSSLASSSSSSRLSGSSRLILNAQSMMRPPPKLPLPPRPTSPVAREADADATAGDASALPTPRMHDFGPQARSLARWREKLWREGDQQDKESRWYRRRRAKAPFRFTPAQRRELKRWFDFIDHDGSGDISVEELKDPLLSTGIAQNFRDIEKLLAVVDKDDSGGIDFAEFLQVLRPSDATAASGDPAHKAFMELQSKLDTTNAALSLPVMVTMQRRQFLLDAVLTREAEHKKVQAKLKAEEDAALRDGDRARAAQLRAESNAYDLQAARKMERMKALHTVIARQVRGDFAASQHGLPHPSLDGLGTSPSMLPGATASDAGAFVSAGPSENVLPPLDAENREPERPPTDTDAASPPPPSPEAADTDFVFNMQVKRQIHRLNDTGGGMRYNPSRDWDKALVESGVAVAPVSSRPGVRPRGVEFVVAPRRPPSPTDTTSAAAHAPPSHPPGSLSDTESRRTAGSPRGGAHGAVSTPVRGAGLKTAVTPSTLVATGTFDPAHRGVVHESHAGRHLLSSAEPLAEVRQEVVPLKTQQRVVRASGRTSGVGPRLRVGFSAARPPPNARIRQATEASVRRREAAKLAAEKAAIKAKTDAEQSARDAEWALSFVPQHGKPGTAAGKA